MPSKEIKELRQAGRLDEALAMATLELQSDPENVWAKRNISWVYYEYAKRCESPETFNDFCQYISQILNLQLPEDDTMIFENIAWLVVKKVFALLRTENPDIVKINTLFSSVKNLHLTKPSEVYSSLFKAFHKGFKDTFRYLEFADWWNFENFRPEDYAKEIFNKKEIMSTVEQAYIAYAKYLLPKQTVTGEIYFNPEKAKDFLSKLDQIEEQHPEYQYPPYFKAKLLLALGDQDNVLVSLLPFAKKKRNDFWVWEILSEAVANDEEKIFACYCRGLLCHAPEEMVVKLREKIVPYFLKREMWNEAKTEIENIQKIRNQKQWKISNTITQWINQPWFLNAKTTNNNLETYKRFAPIADDLLFSDILEEPVIVEFVNSEKKILNFITSQDQIGFFKYDHFLKKVKIGDVLKVRFLKKENSGLYQPATVEKSDDPIFKAHYTKEFEGIVSIREENNFGFVKPDIFLSPEYCHVNQLKKRAED